MAGLCDEQFPPDFEPEPGHFVACWLYKDNLEKENAQASASSEEQIV
jgi:hypothetical protein